MASISETTRSHEPVLVREVLAGLALAAGKNCIDGTFGGGGHARALLEATYPNGQLLAIDADPAAASRAAALSSLPENQGRLHFVNDNFVHMQAIASDLQFAPVAAILLDLGMSSFQLDEPERGFSFLRDGPLDMRFDPSMGESVAELTRYLSADEISSILWRYGEERHSRRIAAAIVANRSRQPLETTAQLAELVEDAVGGRRGAATHPATRTFQALRIAVNEELTNLPVALEGAVSLLQPGGRLAVISFHSLEDRIVKQFIANASRDCICPPEQPICTCDHIATMKATVKATKPEPDEIRKNPRSRSAVLRIAEKLPPC